MYCQGAAELHKHYIYYETIIFEDAFADTGICDSRNHHAEVQKQVNRIQEMERAVVLVQTADAVHFNDGNFLAHFSQSQSGLTADLAAADEDDLLADQTLGTEHHEQQDQQKPLPQQ